MGKTRKPRGRRSSGEKFAAFLLASVMIVVGTTIVMFSCDKLKERKAVTSRFRESMDEAARYAASGHWNAAASAYERALECKPGDRMVLDKLASAKTQVSKLVDIHSSDGEKMLAAGDWRAAILSLGKALSLGATDQAVLEGLERAKAGEKRRQVAMNLEQAGIQWVDIPGGSFVMGSPTGPADAKPAHRVAIKPFQMARTEVTFKQYRACVEAKACAPPHVADSQCFIWNGSEWARAQLAASFQADDQPAVCVDWAQAKAFSEWVGGRLPTEAEWEYAARSAGKVSTYPWGDEPPSCERAVMNHGAPGCGRNSTWPVCSKPKGNTRQGLCDTAGNAWEWTQDWYRDTYTGAAGDGSAWEGPGSSHRAYRGGSWLFDATWAQTRWRNGFDGSPTNDTGLRPVRPAR
ncbi:MAG: SUMF1/EgtB/PvdO family nonheme iron enzyme [Elusimicrobia bacterium]|nr:SUMF1/EgtB/PvdO family nonheme iron enzyme [Elusimicrobiota bacterium]